MAKTPRLSPDNIAILAQQSALLVNSARAKNYIINGGFHYWQRGTSATSNVTGIIADRFKTSQSYSEASSNTALSRQTDSPSLAGQTSTYCLETKTTGALTNVTDFSTLTQLEVQDILPLLGKTATLSFWYKSNRTGSHVANFTVYPTNITVATNSTQMILFTVNTANTWEYKTITVALPAATAIPGALNTLGFQLFIGFRSSNVGQANTLAANDYYRLTQIMLQEGVNATPFQIVGTNLGHELLLCQRYFEKSYVVDVAPGSISQDGIHSITGIGSSNRPFTTAYYKAVKRTAASIAFYNPVTGAANTFRDQQGGVDFAIAASGASSNGLYVAPSGTASNTTHLTIHWTADCEL